MSLQVIIITLTETECDPTVAWMPDFARLDWVPVRAKSLKQVDYCIKSYPNAVITAVIPPALDGVAGQIGELRRIDACRRVVALCAAHTDATVAASLAEAGADFVLPAGAPFSLFKQLVESVREIARAKSGDAGGESARVLAAETRQLLHDINQPLAVLQGRIEILNMKAPPGDAVKETYTLLQEQAVRVGEIVARLHELHRKYK